MEDVSLIIFSIKKPADQKVLIKSRGPTSLGYFLDFTVRKAMVPGQRNGPLVCILKRLCETSVSHASPCRHVSRGPAGPHRRATRGPGDPVSEVSRKH